VKDDDRLRDGEAVPQGDMHLDDLLQQQGARAKSFLELYYKPTTGKTALSSLEKMIAARKRKHYAASTADIYLQARLSAKCLTYENIHGLTLWLNTRCPIYYKKIQPQFSVREPVDQSTTKERENAEEEDLEKEKQSRVERVVTGLESDTSVELPWILSR